MNKLFCGHDISRPAKAARVGMVERDPVDGPIPSITHEVVCSDCYLSGQVRDGVVLRDGESDEWWMRDGWREKWDK